ncbi:MAG: CoA pyrophosphatase [Chloroflexota bacterium]
MINIIMEDQLRNALSSKPEQLQATNDERLAAVLIPMFCKEGQYHILFTKRTMNMQRHRGEISFPGGAYEDQDGSLLNTALRETAEEIGLAPADINVLGALDTTPTVASGYLIYPFLGVIPWPHTLRLERWEIDEVFDVPIPVLMDKNCFREEIRERDGRSISVFYYDYQGRTIWGATAKILHNFLNIFNMTIVPGKLPQT